jgi:integrase
MKACQIVPILNLTDLTVKSLVPGLYMDRKTPAFGLRVGKNRKTWIVLKEPNRTKVRLGHYPDLPLIEARRRAHVALGTPFVAKEESVSFELAKLHFLEDNYRDKKPRTKHETTRLLNRFAFKGTLADLDDGTIERELAKLKSVPSEQLHAFRALRTMLRWCLRPPHRYIKHSPLEGYPAPSKDRKGNRILTDAELRKVWHACEGYFGDMIRLLILWGTRNGEIGRLQPEWYTDKVMTIPGTHTKNGRAHAIPVLPMARSILDRRKTNGVYYFTGRTHDSHFNDGSWGKLKKELDKRSGVTGWQCRDLRRTFRSTLARLGVSRELAEIMLNHVTGAGKNDLDEIYDRYDRLREKRAALQKLETHLKKILGG